ncbi:MAG TPA: outer membrane beta-barrel protein [Hanamia sp.]
MKNYTTGLLFPFLFFCTDSFAQMKKENFALSGKTDLSFLLSNTIGATDSIETGRAKSNQYGFRLDAGYFIADNFMVGLSGAYSYSYTKIVQSAYLQGNENITTTLAIVPQVSYFFPLEGKLKPSVTVGAGYMIMRERDSRVLDNNNLVNSFGGPSFNGSVGVSYFINQSVSFDLGLQYSHNKLKDKIEKLQTQTINAFTGNFGVSVFF